MQTHRIILVGAGFWGKKWLAALADWPNLKLAAVVARTESTLKVAAAEIAPEDIVLSTDLPDTLGRADADIVVIVSPAECHVEHIRLSLESGKHVICEKPLSDSADSAAKIAAIVRSHPEQTFMVSQTRRFSNQVETLRRVIAAGKIGAVDFVRFDHRVNFTGGGWRQEMDYPVVQDMICHHLDALRYMTGQEPVSVWSRSWNPSWSQFSGKASTSLLVEMTGGIGVDYFGSWTARGKLNSYDGVMTVMGSAGALELVDAETLLFYPYTGAETAPNPKPEHLSMVDLKYKEIDGVLNAFLRALENSTTPPCDIEDNLKTFAFNDAVLAATRIGGRIDVREKCV